jgi:hypothetical protein
VAEGVGQADPQGLQDLHLLDGFLARGQQDAQCAPGECQEDRMLWKLAIKLINIATKNSTSRPMVGRFLA